MTKLLSGKGQVEVAALEMNKPKYIYAVYMPYVVHVHGALVLTVSRDL